MAELREWLASNGCPSEKVAETLITLGGITTHEDLLVLEDEDFKELAAEGGFTLLEKRKLLNAVRSLKNANAPEEKAPPQPQPQPQPAAQSAIAAVFGAPPQPGGAMNSTGLPGRMDCQNCHGNFPAAEGRNGPDGQWYCSRCVKEVEENAASAVDPNNGGGGGPGDLALAAAAAGAGGGDGSIELRLLAALLGAAAGGGDVGAGNGGPNGAGIADTDTFHMSRDNMINIFKALNIQITRTFSPQLFQFENNFGKVFCRVDNNGDNKCIMQTYAYFQCEITKRIDKIKFAMQWNLKHAFTKLNVDKDEDFCMESDFVLPQPSSGLLPTRGDMKEVVQFLNGVWNQSIITFHMESRHFAAQLRGES